MSDPDETRDLEEIRDTAERHVEKVRQRRDAVVRWAELNLKLIDLRIGLYAFYGIVLILALIALVVWSQW